MAGNFLSDLSQDFAQLFSTSENYDLIIQAGEGQNMKEISAHSLILRTRSEYFKTGLSREWVKRENGIMVFKKPNISPEIFELILKYLYTGIIELDNRDGAQLLKLLIAVDELNLQKLCDYIQSYLTNEREEFLRNNLVDILQTVLHYKDLRKYCLDIICRNPKLVFESPKFTSLEQDLIILFLEQDELEIEEMEIWDYILKWALARMSTPSDADDLSQWTSSDFEELKEILHDLIPHIRWFQIPQKTFWRKISPFESIFPKQLYRDIIGYHFDPDTTPNTLILPQRLNLSLLSKDHLYVIASWIDRKNFLYNSKDTPYSFNLLYRASRDGFEASKFHELCDNKGSTIVISKLKDSGKLVGGYNPKSWKPFDLPTTRRTDFKSISDSFLFSFTKKEETDPAFILRATINGTNAVNYNITTGPIFGEHSDLAIKDNDKIIINNSSRTYLGIQNTIGRGTHTLEDYEVFEVCKRKDQNNQCSIT